MGTGNDSCTRSTRVQSSLLASFLLVAAPTRHISSIDGGLPDKSVNIKKKQINKDIEDTTYRVYMRTGIVKWKIVVKIW